jgi:hypothetical protein
MKSNAAEITVRVNLDTSGGRLTYNAIQCFADGRMSVRVERGKGSTRIFKLRGEAWRLGDFAEYAERYCHQEGLQADVAAQLGARTVDSGLD